MVFILFFLASPSLLLNLFNPSTNTTMETLFKTLILIGILFLFIVAINSYSTTELHVVRIDAIEQLDTGEHLYKLSDGQYKGCIDAQVGKMILIEHKKALLTGKLRYAEPHTMFKCSKS